MKRIAHSKAMGAALMGASLIAIGSVGFSAWVISGGAVTETLNSFGVSVTTVSDNRVAFDEIVSGKKVVWSNAAPTANSAETGSYDKDKTLVNGTVDSSGYNSAEAYLVFGPNTDANTRQIQAEYNSGSLVKKVGDLEHLSLEFTYKLKITTAGNGGKTYLLSNASEVGALKEIQLLFAVDDVVPDSSSTVARSQQSEGISALSAAASNNYIVNPSGIATGAAVTIFQNTTTTTAPGIFQCVGSSTTLISGSDASSVTAITGSNEAYILTTVSGTDNGFRTFTTKMVWRWGSAFSNTNPVNLDLASDTSLSAAITALQALETGLDNKTLRMTIKASGNVN